MEAKGTALIDFLQNDTEIGKVQEQLSITREAVVYGLYEGQRTLVMASLAQRRAQGNLLVVCDTQKRAKELWEDLVQLLQSYEVLYFPALEMIPYEVIAQSGGTGTKAAGGSVPSGIRTGQKVCGCYNDRRFK